MKSGDKIKISIKIEAIIKTELDDVSISSIEDIIQADDAYGFKSVILGYCESDPNYQMADFDTALEFQSTIIKVEEMK